MTTTTPSLIKPRRLQPGMTVGLIAPASAASDVKVIDDGIRGLEALGLNVKPGRHIRSRRGYLAATDSERLADLHAMFQDPKVDAIMCVRGGYGCGRIADAIDYDLVRRHPKILVGFSDITTLNLALLRRAGLVSFSGAMLTFTFADRRPRPFTVSSFLRTLGRTEPAGSIWQDHPEEEKGERQFRVVRHGKARGPLTGGCLSLVAASVGTRYQIETRGRIVFLEDVDEKPYKIDRMLTQLLAAGLLADAAAIVVGRIVPDKETQKLEKKRAAQEGLSHMTSPPPRKVDREFEMTTDEVLADLLRPLGIPVLIGLPFGHIPDYATLPLGVEASVDTRTGDLVIEEAAVTE